MRMRGIICLICFALSLIKASAQNEENSVKQDKKEAGIRVAYSVRSEDLFEDAEYKPILFLPYINYYFSKAESRLRLSGVLEQQVGVAIIDKNESIQNETEWEFGLNAGPELSYRINGIKPYLGAMYGVNVITVETAVQENGLIFTATGMSGIKAELKNNVFLDFHARIRHLSNGGIEKPNFGLDNLFLGAGLSKMY